MRVCHFPSYLNLQCSKHAVILTCARTHRDPLQVGHKIITSDEKQENNRHPSTKRHRKMSMPSYVDEKTRPDEPTAEVVKERAVSSRRGPASASPQNLSASLCLLFLIATSEVRRESQSRAY